MTTLNENTQKWQPIETAPRDGTEIVGRDFKNGHRAIVIFDNNEWSCVSMNGEYLGIGFYPTHWMPLPTPPTEEDK